MLSHVHATQFPQHDKRHSGAPKVLARKNGTRLSISEKRIFINNYSKLHSLPFAKEDVLQESTWHSKMAKLKHYLSPSIRLIQVFTGILIEIQNLLKMYIRKDTREIIKHWDNDKKSLSRLFFDSDKVGKITKIQQLSQITETHHSYRLSFYTGQTIIYKTRSLELEQKFFHLAHLLGFFELNQPDFFTKNSYSWMSFIPTMKNSTAKDGAHIYYNLGLFLSLVYCLDGSQSNLNNLFKQPAHCLFAHLIQSYYSEVLCLTQQQDSKQLKQIEQRIETVTDGFINGYSRISTINFSTNKINDLSKLMPAQYLYKISSIVSSKNNQIEENSNYLFIDEMEFSNQIQQIRVFFAENDLLTTVTQPKQ